MTTIDSCPSGYSNKGGTCVDLNTSFPAESGEYCKDGSVPSNGSCPNMKRAVASIYECAGNEYYDGTYCIPNATYTWVCPSGYNKYTETEGLGAVDMCAKTTSKVSSQGCPSGYNQSGNICKKIDTLSCKVN